MTSGNDVALYEASPLDGYRPQVMTPEVARALDEQVRQCTKAVLREGTDYGIIPGTGEKTLWRPGAQKLLQWFQLECTCDRTDIERDDDGRKHGITYRAEVGRGLKTATPVILATCEGTADYDESKFCQPAEEVQRKAEANERKWAKRDGRVADPTKWKNRGEFRADWNALMKRAQKRAIVGAVSDATGAGGIFTDREEDDSPAPHDGDLSWYEQALGDALAITSKEEGRALYAEVTRAKRSGEATRAQADHIQNRIRQRVEQLDTHIQVDVEDVTPPDASPAQAAPPVAAEPASTPPPGAGEAQKKGGGPAGLIVHHFERLGVTDRNDRLILTAQLARLDDVPASTTKLTAAKQREVLKTLEKCRDLDALNALLVTGEQDAAAEMPDVP